MGMKPEDAFASAIAVAEKHTDDVLNGITMIEGKPCTIASITDITGGKRVTYKWTGDDGTVKTTTMDVMNGQDGAQGPKGDKGNTGNTGATGATGPAGADGTSATIRVGNVTSGESAAVTNSGTNLAAVFDFVLPKGDKGDKGDKGEDGQNGSSFSIRSRFATEEELIAAYPDGPENEGDAYFVGTTSSPNLYIWLVDEHEWHNNGPIAGVKGDKGDQGDEGFSPVANVTKDGGVATITIRDKTGTTTQQISDGANGQNGTDGDDGKSAYEIAKEHGFVGTEAEWLESLVGPQGEPGTNGVNGTNGTDGVSPVANVTKTDDVIKIHIQDSTGTTEEEIDMSDYQKKDLTQAVEEQTTVEGALSALSTNKALKTDITYKNKSLTTTSVDDFGATLVANGVGSYSGTVSVNGTWYNYQSTIQGDLSGSWYGNAILWGDSGDFYTFRKGYSTSTTWIQKKFVTNEIVPSDASASNKLTVSNGKIRGLNTSNWIATSFDDAVPSDNNSMQIFTVLNSAVHTPATGANYMVIVQTFDENNIQQEAIQNTTNNRYIRHYNGTTWSSWEKLVTNSNEVYLYKGIISSDATDAYVKSLIGAVGHVHYYSVQGNSTAFPTSYFGDLEVVRPITNLVLQTFRGFNSSNPHTYQRRSTDSGSTWSDWQKLVTESDLNDYVISRKSIEGTLDATSKTVTFNLSQISSNVGVALFDVTIELSGGTNLHAIYSASLGRYSSTWRINTNMSVSNSDVGTVTFSINGTTLICTYTGTCFGGKIIYSTI